tara:strand:- start:6264 stop:6494 length:231 start_codon:yes stop_codon:yes gene_type:complete
MPGINSNKFANFFSKPNFVRFIVKRAIPINESIEKIRKILKLFIDKTSFNNETIEFIRSEETNSFILNPLKVLKDI